MVNAAHSVIKYSEKMRKKYLSLVRRTGKNRAIVAIARILLEIIYTMLKKGEDFVDKIEPLTERKKAAMMSRAVKPAQIITVEDRMNELRNVQKERMKRFSDADIVKIWLISPQLIAPYRKHEISWKHWSTCD